MSLNLSKEVLSRRVWNQGIYELHSTKFMLSQTPKYIDPGKNVIDVGAAVGMYSYFFAEHLSKDKSIVACNKVYAFEAVGPVFDQLSKLAVNSKPNIIPINKAVGNFNGVAEFYVDDKRLSNSSFRNLVAGQKIEVDVVKLDDMDFGSVGFIKIDCEGHELDVLEGAEHLIDEQHPNLMVEIYPKLNNGPVDKTFKFLFDKGYSCLYNMKGKGLVEVLNIQHGVDVASSETLIQEHDGDFLFVWDK